jgi:hypothetical protein
MKKNVYLVMCMMLVVTFTLSAQQPMMNRSKQVHRNERSMEHRQRGLVTPQMRADRMATELGLSEGEKAKVKDLFEKEDANKVKRMDEVQKIRKEMKAKIDGDKKSITAELEKIIGKDKVQKLADKREEMRAKMENKKKEGRGGREAFSVEKSKMNRPHYGQKSKRDNERRQNTIVTPQMHADRMTAELGLTENENAKVKNLFEKEDAIRVKRMDEAQKMKKEMKAIIENDKKSSAADLEKIIGMEKVQKLADKREEMKSKMKNNMQKCGEKPMCKGANAPERRK